MSVAKRTAIAALGGASKKRDPSTRSFAANRKLAATAGAKGREAGKGSVRVKAS